MEGAFGVVGGGNCQLRPKRGKLLADAGVAEMVRLWGLRDPKRNARCLFAWNRTYMQP